MSTRPAAQRLQPVTQRATCWAAIDCGRQTWWFEERPRHVRELRLSFELLDETTRAGDRRVVEARYALSFWPTANLKRDLESWLMRPLSMAEREGGFDFTALLGRSARLRLLARGRYRAITEILPAFGPDFPPNRAPLALSLETGRFDPEAFHRLPDRLKDRICASPTFHALHEADEDIWPAEHVRPATGAELIGDEIPW